MLNSLEIGGTDFALVTGHPRLRRRPHLHTEDQYQSAFLSTVYYHLFIISYWQNKMLHATKQLFLLALFLNQIMLSTK